MRNFGIIILLLHSLIGLGQSKKSAVTVILFDNNVPDGKKMVADTVMKNNEIDLAVTAIDLYFTCKYFNMPYYVPTGGIYKNTAKDSECDMKIYPRNVKCYEYDSKNRVIKMNVSGSGTINNFIYKYNNENQVTEITDIATKFILKYNSDQTLSELTQSDGIVKKKLVFIYQ